MAAGWLTELQCSQAAQAREDGLLIGIVPPAGGRMGKASVPARTANTRGCIPLHGDSVSSRVCCTGQLAILGFIYARACVPL